MVVISDFMSNENLTLGTNNKKNLKVFIWVVLV
jgi:hypothetical protein